MRRSAAPGASPTSISPGSRSRCRPTISTAISGSPPRRRRRLRSANRCTRSAHFREYMARCACSIVQVDVARIGGITPWLKVAHAAEAFDMPVCPHFLMELHVSLACAVPNGKYVEYIPQLDKLTTSRLSIENGMALAPNAPGIGVEWNFDVVKAKSLPEFTRTIGGTR